MELNHYIYPRYMHLLQTYYYHIFQSVLDSQPYWFEVPFTKPYSREWIRTTTH